MARFCERLKMLREKFGISQQQLADDLQISRSSVGNYELGAREPDFETLEAFADYFNVDMDYLIGKSVMERKIPVLKQMPPVPKQKPLSDREERLLSSFRLLSDDMQDRLLDLTEATAKTSRKHP